MILSETLKVYWETHFRTKINVAPNLGIREYLFDFRGFFSETKMVFEISKCTKGMVGNQFGFPAHFAKNKKVLELPALKKVQ